MYMRPPSAAELAAAGLLPEDLEGDTPEVWPENLQAFELFSFMQTQWRGAGLGLIGLDYCALFHKMDRMNLDPARYQELEDDVRVMEFAAIAAMNEKKD